jgi:hypothetical protein
MRGAARGTERQEGCWRAPPKSMHMARAAAVQPPSGTPLPTPCSQADSASGWRAWVETPALVAGYPRGPGSFCALNPEGCPPEPPPAQPESAQDLESPANKQACLDACEAGGEILKNFCRRLRTPRKKALCWGAAEGTKQACRSMCNAIYECGGSADCAQGAGP